MDIKECRSCHNIKPVSEFQYRTREHNGNIYHWYEPYCKACCRIIDKMRYQNNPSQTIERNKRYQHNHPSKVAEWRHSANQRRKVQALTYYGNGKCACVQCGESRLACLSIDHINGGGHQHRISKELTKYSSFYRWLELEHYPSGYQTLCMNCQFLKRELAWTLSREAHFKPLESNPRITGDNKERE